MKANNSTTKDNTPYTNPFSSPENNSSSENYGLLDLFDKPPNYPKPTPAKPKPLYTDNIPLLVRQLNEAAERIPKPYSGDYKPDFTYDHPHRKRSRRKPSSSPKKPKSIYRLDEGETRFNPDKFIDTPLNDAAWFYILFRPFTRHYLKKITYSGNSQWMHQASPLTLQRLQNSIIKGHEISWFSSIRTPVLGLDIDFHTPPYNKCWSDNSPSKHLSALYQ